MDQNAVKTPYNIEAEEALLGSIFIKPDVLSEIIELVTEDDFYKNKYNSSFLFCLIEILINVPFNKQLHVFHSECYHISI